MLLLVLGLLLAVFRQTQAEIPAKIFFYLNLFTPSLSTDQA